MMQEDQIRMVRVAECPLWKCYHERMVSKTCTVEGCPKNGQLKGYCIKHADDNADLPRCDFNPCEKAARHLGLCSSHYQEKRNTGVMTARPQSAECTYPGCQGTVKKHVPFCPFHIKANVKLKCVYGISLSEKIERSAQCGGRCQSCGDLTGLDALVVDHCHSTGKVRGLLCSSCNKMLGFAFDSTARLHLAAAYLEENSC